MTETLAQRIARALGPQDIDFEAELPGRSQGGGFVTPVIDSAVSGFTLPGDVYRGTADLNTDEGFARVMDLAGLMQLGGAAGDAPAGALRAGMGRASDEAARSAGALARYLDDPHPVPVRDVTKPRGTIAFPPPPERAIFERQHGRNAPFPQFAEHYPPPPIPELKVDKASGKQYLGKGKDATNTAFMAERLAIQKDMDAHGFTPYFDPAQRFDVDPAHYPTDVDTLTQAVGAKPATRAKHEAVAMAEDALARLDAAYHAGRDVPDADRWYWMGQLERAFVDELGEDAGREAFKRRFAGAMAATTGGMDPQSNLMAAAYGNYLQTHGLPYPSNSYDIPSPLGGPYITGNMAMHDKFSSMGMNIGVDNPKRHDFQYNFLGHGNKATIDEQMSGLIQPGMQAPPAGNYGSYELPVHHLAAQYGVDPREFQEVAWAGGKALKDPTGLINHKPGKPMIQFVNEAIERTHRLTGLPREEILRRGLIRGEIPLYSNHSAALGAALSQDEGP